MFSRACLPAIFFSLLLAGFSAAAQSPEPTANPPLSPDLASPDLAKQDSAKQDSAKQDPAQQDLLKLDLAKQAIARKQSAMNMIDEILAGTSNLSLPQNRLAIESLAFPALWSRNQPRARALVNQIAAEFAQAASRRDEDSRTSLSPMLHQQRASLVETIAQSDAELALHFLTATGPYMQDGDVEQNELQEQALRLSLAAQIASRNPARALQMAEQELQASGELPNELLNLLQEVEAHDQQAGLQLFHDIVSRLKSADLTQPSDFNFAFSLLNNEFSRNSQSGGVAADDALRSLADTIASAALSPQFPQFQFGQLPQAFPAFDQLAPGKAPALRQLVRKYSVAPSQQVNVWDDFNQAEASGNSEKAMALIAQAPNNVRPSMIQQAAMQSANRGDLQSTREFADRITDPAQRSDLMQQAIRSAASQAADRRDFPTALQLSAQMISEPDRAVLLSELALKAARFNQPRLAEEMLDEASSLLVNHPPAAEAFAAQLQVAQAYLHIDPARAMPLLERSSSQLEQVLAAAEQIDAFAPYQHSFEGSELILSDSFFFNSLVRPYAMAAAELANIDLVAARTLADRLRSPEARLMAELFVARSALGESNAEVQFRGANRWLNEDVVAGMVVRD
jgi:hypothetical protein